MQVVMPARAIALGRSIVTGGGRSIYWDTDLGCPSFITDRPGYEIKRDPSRLEAFKDYVRNIARWLKKTMKATVSWTRPSAVSASYSRTATCRRIDCPPDSGMVSPTMLYLV